MKPHALADCLENDARVAMLRFNVGFPSHAGVFLRDAQVLQLLLRADIKRGVWPEAGKEGVGKMPVAACENDVARLQFFPPRFRPTARHGLLGQCHGDELLTLHDARVAHQIGHEFGRAVLRLIRIALQPPRQPRKPRAHRV